MRTVSLAMGSGNTSCSTIDCSCERASAMAAASDSGAAGSGTSRRRWPSMRATSRAQSSNMAWLRWRRRRWRTTSIASSSSGGTWSSARKLSNTALSLGVSSPSMACAPRRASVLNRPMTSLNWRSKSSLLRADCRRRCIARASSASGPSRLKRPIRSAICRAPDSCGPPAPSRAMMRSTTSSISDCTMPSLRPALMRLPRRFRRSSRSGLWP